jgi:hypothetical protein
MGSYFIPHRPPIPSTPRKTLLKMYIEIIKAKRDCLLRLKIAISGDGCLLYKGILSGVAKWLHLDINLSNSHF